VYGLKRCTNKYCNENVQTNDSFSHLINVDFQIVLSLTWRRLLRTGFYTFLSFQTKLIQGTLSIKRNSNVKSILCHFHMPINGLCCSFWKKSFFINLEQMHCKSKLVNLVWIWYWKTHKLKGSRKHTRSNWARSFMLASCPHRMFGCWWLITVAGSRDKEKWVFIKSIK